MSAAHATVHLGAPGEPGVDLGTGRPKIIVPVMPHTVADVPAAVAALAGQPVDLVEWRVDHVAGPDSPADVGAALREGLRRSSGAGLPLLTTYRTDREGGEGHLPDAAYATLVVDLLTRGLADAVDVEYQREAGAVGQVIAAAHAAGVPVVTSFHDFHTTPEPAEIVGHLRAQAAAGGDVVKIAVTPRTPADVAALLTATAAAVEELTQPVLAISMGALGLISRVAAETFGSCATFAMVGTASAPGQIPADTLEPMLKFFTRG